MQERYSINCESILINKEVLPEWILRQRAIGISADLTSVFVMAEGSVCNNRYEGSKENPFMGESKTFYENYL